MGALFKALLVTAKSEVERALGDALRQAGAEIIPMPHAARAIAALSESPEIEAVIVDVRLDGAGELIAAAGPDRVALAIVPDEAQAARALASGAWDVLLWLPDPKSSALRAAIGVHRVQNARERLLLRKRCQELTERSTRPADEPLPTLPPLAEQIGSPLAAVLANLDYSLERLKRRDIGADDVAAVREALAEAQEGAARAHEVVRSSALPPPGEQRPPSVRPPSRAEPPLPLSDEPTPDPSAPPSRRQQPTAPQGKRREQASPDAAALPRRERSTDPQPFSSREPRRTSPTPPLDPRRQARTPREEPPPQPSAPSTGAGPRSPAPLRGEGGERQRASVRAEGGESEGSVLLVDGDPAVSTQLRHLWPEMEVVAALSGSDARRLLASGEPFDMVLCELSLPDGSGLQLYSRLLGERPELADRFALTTGSQAEMGRLAGGDLRVVEKPFDIAVLRSIMRSFSV